MKSLTILISSLCIGQVLLSQSQYDKYKSCFLYVDSCVKSKDRTVDLNVSSVIRFMEISPFENQIKSFIDSTIKNFHDFKDKYGFEPYVDKNIDSVFNISNTKNLESKTSEYLIFSKPIDESLIVLEMFGDYKRASVHGYLFGPATKYLFIFDSQNKIKEVYSTEISFN